VSGLPNEFEGKFATASAPEGIGESIFDDAPQAELMETAAGSDSDPAIEFRRTLGMFATGVTVITTRVGEQIHGMTANAFMSVSLQPPLILISVDRRARMNALLRENVRYGVSVLEERQTALSDRFAGRPGDEGEPLFEIVHETPLVEGALAHLVARVLRSYWGGDHSLFLGRVEYARYGEGTPLLFHGGGYEELLGPILAAGVEHAYADGDAIMRAGEPGDFMALVLEGTVRVERPGRSARMTVGDLVGEIPALDGGPRTADVTAEGTVRCLEIARASLLAAIEASPPAATALIGILAARFRESD
jgi:flavin reductase (DIM6/NTAB) family NADH-FMN oxidoreductase RutF